MPGSQLAQVRAQFLNQPVARSLSAPIACQAAPQTGSGNQASLKHQPGGLVSLLLNFFLRQWAR